VVRGVWRMAWRGAWRSAAHGMAHAGRDGKLPGCEQRLVVGGARR